MKFNGNKILNLNRKDVVLMWLTLAIAIGAVGKDQLSLPHAGW